MKERLDIDAILVAVGLEGFQHGVEADSIPVLEAVRQCLLAAVDANGDSVDQVRFDPFRIGCTAEPEMPHGRIGQPWWFCPSGNGDTDFVGDLGGEFMPSERRDQTEHTVGNLESDGDQVRIAKRRSIRQSVQPPTEQFDPTGITESVQSPGMNTGLQSIACAEHPAVGAEVVQRRRDQVGFFGMVFDAHVDKYISTTLCVPVFLSLLGQECEKANRDQPWPPHAMDYTRRRGLLLDTDGTPPEPAM